MEKNRRLMDKVRAVLLVHSCWIDNIYEELIQSRSLQICVLLFVLCVFVYKLHSMLLSCRANIYFVIELILDAKLF